MKTVIVVGYVCIGKTEAANQFNRLNSKALDVNVDLYKNSETYPKNMIDDVVSVIGKYDVIFLPYSKDIIKALDDNGLVYVLAAPDNFLKAEIVGRMVLNGYNQEKYLDIIESWDRDLNDIERMKLITNEAKGLCASIKLRPDKNNLCESLSFILSCMGNYKK